MIIELNTTWTRDGSQDRASGSGIAFDTETKEIVPFFSSKVIASFEPVPPNVRLPAGFYLAFECEGYTLTQWYYDGSNGFTTAVTDNSGQCGYVLPDNPDGLTCDLGAVSLSQGGTAGALTLTASVGGTAHGELRFALDGGAEQASATFTQVELGEHTVVIRDTGLTGCTRSVTLVVVPPAPPAAPEVPAAGFDFVQQPLWYSAAAVAGTEVVLELYAESQHRQEDFSLVFTLRKRANAQGQVFFRLDTLLAPLLAAVVPPPFAEDVVVCRTPLANYFVRTAPAGVDGQPGPFSTSALRTALRGSLPAELRDVDYFAHRLEAYSLPPFLSWQPAGKVLTPTQPEWLFWLCPPGSPGVLTIRRRYVRTGFAQMPPEVEEESVDLSAGRGPVGQLLAIPVRPREDADSVSLAIYDAEGEALSPLHTYRIVPATPRSRYLLFTNSLGGFDTLRTTGRLENLLEATADRHELPALPQGGLAERQTFEVTASRKLKLATGWLTRAQLAWLQELVLAREIWEWKAGRLLPLDPSKRQLVAEADDPPLRGMLLEFDYAFAPTAYANLP